MIKKTIKETVREYDEEGKMVRETVTETVEDDDTIYWPYSPYNTPFINSPITPCNGQEITCDSQAHKNTAVDNFCCATLN